ncbi:lipoprotein [Streptomyces avidinii]
MGAIRTSPSPLLGAAAAGAVLVLGPVAAAPASAAEAAPITSFGFAITPSTVAPGGQTVLSVTGCNAAFATVSSGIFDTVSIERGKTARVTVDRDARRGAQYSVSFTCDGETGSADLTITGGTSKPTTSSTAGARPSGSASTGRTSGTGTGTGTGTGASRPASPAGQGVRGGLGGSIAGLDPLEVAAGGGLVLGGLVGLGYALRRRDIRRIH